MADRDTLIRILDLARWAPSGDNTQPWRFEIVSDGMIAVHGFDTRDHVVYDFDGHASHIAHGALLETLRIAATGFGCIASWTLRLGCSDSAPIYDVRVRKADGVSIDPLLPFIERRVVQRRPMRATPLTASQRQALAAAPGGAYEVRFCESFADRVSIAKLLWDNAYIRLTCPEAFEVHREVIEWGVRYSKHKIPEQAVGVDPLTGKLMRWVMQRWERVDFFNRYLLGTIVPRIQLDFMPALRCAAHMMFFANRAPSSMLDYVSAGIALQRLWLTAHSVGLHLQPEMTPVIFNWYARAGRSFSSVPGMDGRVRLLADRLAGQLGPDKASGLMVMCRVGVATSPKSRSTRRELAELMSNN